MRIAAPLLLLLVCAVHHRADAEDLIVRLENADGVSVVGAVMRWDSDGNPTRAVDPKAKIQSPPMDAIGQRQGGEKWLFSDLAPGHYDLLILAQDQVRIEGFGYPPVLEFDPFVDAQDEPAEAATKWITEDIAKSRHYENKVTPLHFAGNENQIRVLVQLLRDKPTSFDSQLGEQAATLRHEIWQYSHRYGAWSKEKRTRVMDRLLMPKRELRTWTWIWEPTLGMIEVTQEDVEIRYRLPAKFTAENSRGLLPY